MLSQVCGSMPYDDSNIKKMIRYQTERKVAFSRSKHLSQDCKDLIHRMLEADIKKRIPITDIKHMTWIAETASRAATAASKASPQHPTLTVCRAGRGNYPGIVKSALELSTCSVVRQLPM